MFDLDRNACQSSQIYDWPLVNIRKTIVHLVPSSNLTSRLCDVAFGPSGLLLAIKETMSLFNYLGSEDDQRHLVNSDLYEFVFSSFDSGQTLVTKVRTRNNEVGENSDEFKNGKSMADIANKTGKNIRILSVEVCNVRSADLRDPGRRTSKEFECKSDEFLFQVHFFLVAQLTGGPLIGQGLDKDHSYDFHKDPFSLPIGIGCWAHVDPEHKNHRKAFTIGETRFSAHYITSNGTRSFSYVAYDSQFMLLRLDRNERKGIYDLDRGLSYHEDEFRSVKRLTNLADVTKNCVVLETSIDMFGGLDLMQRLIGLAHGASAPYLGSRTIDNSVFSVYETELVFSGFESGYNLPILLELSQFSMPKSDVNAERRFFVTYYVTESLQLNRERQQDYQIVDQAAHTAIPKYIELWQFDLENLQRKLLNRLEFSEFSWSLDVAPADDLTNPDLIGIFNVASCAQQRASQLQLKYRIGPDVATRSSVSKTDLTNVFLANQQLFRRSILSKMLAALEIPALNVVRLEIATLEGSDKLLVESQIVELPRGDSSDKLLGFVNYETAQHELKHHVLAYHFNRHSLDSCRLDSLAQPADNSLIYCDKLALCLIVKQAPAQNYIEKVNANSSSSYQLASISCPMYEFSWTLRPREKHESILTRVWDNKYKLSASTTRINFELASKDKTKTKQIEYAGYNFGPEIKRLDALCTDCNSKARSPAILSMRHTVNKEDSKASNANIPVNLPTFGAETFAYCQLACQLDAYCNSFSICLRRRSKLRRSQPYDCVLSSFRLTGDSIEQLKALSLDTNSSGYTPTTSQSNSSYTFKLDLDCNLHPKDVLLGSLDHPIRLRTTNEQDDVIIDANEANTTNVAQEPLVASLEECADLSHRNSVGNISISSNFVYCHLKSYCIPHNANGSNLPKATVGQICYLYTMSHTQFYEKTPFCRMAIIRRPLDRGQEQQQRHLEPSTGNRDNQFKSSFDLMISLKLGRFFMNLDSANCAELCDLHSSNCLAFDSCKSADSSMHFCFLYSIRSPFARVSSRLKLVGLEERVYGESRDSQSNETIGRAMVVADSHCDHYNPKRIFLEIKLRQFEQSNDEEESRARELSDKNEEELIGQAQNQSAKILKETLELRQKLSENSISELGISWTANTILLLLGLLIGSCGSLFGGQGLSQLSDLWLALKTGAPLRRWRRRRHGENRRISEISLSLEPNL